MKIEEQPLISIITFVKNRKDVMWRCMDSVLNQTYDNIEYVIQDGASTDGTLELIQSYDDSRIKFESCTDRNPSEAWFKSLKRCTGKYIGLVMSDETFLPDAVQWAVDAFRKHPVAGAVYGDGYITNYEGEVISEALAPKHFSFEKYLMNECLPHPGNTFFLKDAIIEAGLFTRDWVWEACEYEVYLRVGDKYPIVYHPGYVSNFAIHDKGQLGKNVENLYRIAEAEVKIFKDYFSADDLNPDIKSLENEAYSGIYRRTAEMLVCTNNFVETQYWLSKCTEINCNFNKVYGSVKRIMHVYNDFHRRSGRFRRNYKTNEDYERLVKKSLNRLSYKPSLGHKLKDVIYSMLNIFKSRKKSHD